MIGNGVIEGFFVFAGVFGFLFLLGIAPAVLKASDKRKHASSWAIKSVDNTMSNGVGTPIDMLQPQVQPQTMQPQAQVQPQQHEDNVVALFDNDLNGFQHSNVELPELEDNVQVLINTMNEFKAEQLAATKEQIEFLVGEKSSELITSDLRNLSTGEHVICGIFDANNSTIEFDNTFVELSTEEDIRIDSGDFVLVKGHLLPNGAFRVLHWDDPENIEAGYGIEEFKIAA